MKKWKIKCKTIYKLQIYIASEKNNMKKKIIIKQFNEINKSMIWSDKRNYNKT